jgi:hypothetical protein
MSATGRPVPGLGLPGHAGIRPEIVPRPVIRRPARPARPAGRAGMRSGRILREHRGAR